MRIGGGATRFGVAIAVVVGVAGTVAAQVPAEDDAGRANPRPPFLKRLVLDLSELGARPAHLDRDDWRTLGLAAVAVGGTALLDEEIREAVQRNRSQGGDDLANAIRPLGHREGALAVIAVIWTVGWLRDDPRLVAIGEDSLEATLVAAGMITPVVKRMTGRSRPVEEAGAYRFDPFSGSQSFPSGEATQAFTIAAVVAAHSKRSWVRAAAWSAAALIGLERLELDRHWASDVVAGALIGSGTGRWVVRRRSARTAATAPLVGVSPMIVEGGFGVLVSASW